MVRTDFDKKMPPSELGIFNGHVNDTSSPEETAPWNCQKRYSMRFHLPSDWPANPAAAAYPT
jgi:hypothetical protein